MVAETWNATHVYHKIKMHGKKSKYSAWFKGDPIKDSLAYIIDCERSDSLGRSFPCTEAEEVALLRGAWSSAKGCEFKRA